jgi:hypothetical protein
MKGKKWIGVALVLAACGSRTALIVDQALDASTDASVRDASVDRRDGFAPDVIPPIDVVLPDVLKPVDCADAAATYIYLFSDMGDLLSFDPLTNAVKNIGKVSCGTTLSPNSMAVDHLGIAYTDYYGPDAGQMFKLSTANASCYGTTYTPQMGFTKYGMAFLGDTDGGESLFIADTLSTTGALASVDVKTFKLTYVGPFQPSLPSCELTGTGDGRLFAFCIESNGATLAQIDPATAKVIGADKLQTGGPTYGFAFGFWGGDFYLFTGMSGSTITKFDPQSKKESVVGTTSQLIVGAGVSTCAPL